MPSRSVQPALMMPLRRCGSHALRLRLNFNPDFYSPYPLHVVDFMPVVPLYGDLADDRNYRRLIGDFVGLQELSLVPWPIKFDRASLFERVKNLPRSIHALAWEMLIQAGEAQGAKLVMDKSLDSVHYWREILELYPEMLFLQVVRDPRAQVSSMNRAIIYDFNTLLNAQRWEEAFRLGQEIAQSHPSRVLTIRFEDFIHDEEKTLKLVCDFLKIRFLPEMLDIKRSEEAVRIAKQSELWESNSSRPIAANVDKFKASLSDDEIEIIETVTSEFMEKFGYRKMTAAKKLITPAMLIEAQKSSAVKRAAAWESLRIKNPEDYAKRKTRAEYISRLIAQLSPKAESTPA